MRRRIFGKEFITMADLYLAYRKAKADAFFDNYHPHAVAYTEYEQNLKENLERLLQRVYEKSISWKDDLEFLGGYLYVPKSIDTFTASEADIHYVDVNPWSEWINNHGKRGTKARASYRLLISPTVDYQIISALWIVKVGEKFESILDSDLSYGNRLRRKWSWNSAIPNKSRGDGELNLDCRGLFSPYFSAYQKWRGGGLDAMKKSVQESVNATAITMDLAGFYHNVSPRFLLRPSFLKRSQVVLTADERRLTQYLLDSIDTWYQSTPDYRSRPEGALPVGLSASKVISNVLLHQLDCEISEKLDPIYYGRYVDDLFLVIATPDGAHSGRHILKYIADRMPSLVVKYVAGKEPDLRLKFSYASDSNLFFTAKKQKIFHLSSEHGLDLVDQIASQIRARSSEYRLLPELPNSAADMAVDSLLVSSNASLAADALRKADVVSIRRLGFSLLLGDVEAYSRDLNREAWSGVRDQFYLLVDRHLLSPLGMFELSAYYQRVFKLAIANEDFEFARSFVTKLFDCLLLLEKTTKVESGARALKHGSCKDYFAKLLYQGGLQAATTRGFTEWRKLGQVLRHIHTSADIACPRSTAPYLKTMSHKLLLADWGSRPYKDYWFYDQPMDIRDARMPRSLAVQRVINWLKIKKFTRVAELKTPHWPALTFPTRPLTIQEIGLIAPSVFSDDKLFRDAIRGLRGAKVRSVDRVGFFEESDDRYFYVPHKHKKTVRVALTNFKTNDQQWATAARGKPDWSKSRYEKITKLINDILRENQTPDYIIFPECSIPRHWAIAIAGKLAQQGISMMAGLEYYEHRTTGKKLRNDSIVSLATRWPGYKSNIVFMQPKLQPSHGEKYRLSKMKRKQFMPAGGIDEIPIYVHGHYIFGLVNCSDLTTPQNRVKYQGKVDGLFVLEWNPDVKTFGFLVEGAAHDVHTFVVQVNNRLFGDSRVRAPYRVDHQRDLVRVKGGVQDYFVLATMNFLSLRQYQRRNRMADREAEFKPVPIGFKMSELRRRLSRIK